jgi:hypothetical protein
MWNQACGLFYILLLKSENKLFGKIIFNIFFSGNGGDGAVGGSCYNLAERHFPNVAAAKTPGIFVLILSSVMM